MWVRRSLVAWDSKSCLMSEDDDLTDYMKVALEAYLTEQGVEAEDVDPISLNTLALLLLPVVSAVLNAYREAHAPESVTTFLEDIG